MDSLPRFHRWSSSAGLTEKNRHKWTSANNIRHSHGGSTYQLELEHLIEAFRRSVLLGHESPLSPPASPRNVHPLHSLDHGHLGEPLIFCNDSSSEEFNTALCSDTDDTMEGPLSLQDVFHTFQHKHVFVTGGHTCEGYPVLHLPDTGTLCQVPDEDFRRLLKYLAGVPLPHEQDAGFVIIVDRRRDKWSSVKTVLLKISGFFPGIIQIVFVLKPTGFLQKALSEVSHKLFRDEFNFQVVLLSSTSELHSYIHPSQLTQDIGGHLPYDHRLWCDQRLAVEKYSIFLAELSASIREVSRHFQETELPNDADTTYNLLQDQGGEYQNLKDSLLSAAERGKDLLAKVRVQPPEVIPYNTLDHEDMRQRQQRQSLNANECSVRQMMQELVQHERNLDSFWLLHKERLNQCLQLRRFETQFKEVHINMTANIRDMQDMTELGDSVKRVDTLKEELENFAKMAEDDLEKADHLQRIGSRLLEGGHYAMDSIEPKCVELERLCVEFKEKYNLRKDKLVRYRDLQERVERANRWCTEGIELLAGLHIEKCTSPDFAEKALDDLNRFLDTAKEFRMGDTDEFQKYFEDFINSETRPLLQQVLKRIDDVRVMCVNRQTSLRKLASVRSASKPVQAVAPEMSPPDKTSSSSRTSLKAKIEVQLPLENPCAPLVSPTEGLKDKRGHVMMELIETEKTYVSELDSVIEGYQKQMSNSELKHMIPPTLQNRADVLFGNMADILAFHRDVFLNELQAYQTRPEQVGSCFVERSEEFHHLYTVYCMNKPRSEALRAQCANDDAFFKECQRRLNHKLPLDAYLLKPVQRITKYQLLLKDLLKYTTLQVASEESSTQQLQQAVDTMLDVLRHVNDSMHQVSITGFHGTLADYGKLLLQGPFNVWMEEKKRERSVKDLRFKPSRRYIFLYEQLILFTKRQGRDENLLYAFKNALKTSQIGLTENLKGRGDKRKFEVWLHGRSQVFTIQAPSLEIKSQWINSIKAVLLQQFELLKDENSRKYVEASSYTSGRTLQHRPMRHNTIGGPNSTTHLNFPTWERQHSLQSTPISTPTTSLGLGHGEHYSSNSSLSALPNFTLSLQPQTTGFGPQQKSPLGRRATLPALRRRADSDVEDGWSTDDLRSDEDDEEDLFIPPSQIGHLYMALGDYAAVDVGEASLCEGQTVQVMRIGCAGWWYVRGVDQVVEGWVPASYLGAVGTSRPTLNTRSSPSISSQDSGCGVGPSGPSLRHTYSRNSVASNLSTTSLDP